MMSCDITGTWDFSMKSPAPPQILPPSRDKGQRGECTDLVVVTAASRDYFERARNLAGSLHVWEPHTLLLLYDLGLDPQQARSAAGWKNVQLKTLHFDALPVHFRWNGWETSTYAFKPLVVSQALDAHDCVLWLDSGVEVRQPLHWARSWLRSHGVLLIHSGWPFPNSWVHPAALVALNKSAYPSTEDKETNQKLFGDFTDPGGLAMKEVWSGVLGVRRSERIVYQYVIRPWYECALERECIAPRGSNKTNHRQDQTALSILVLGQPLIRDTYRIFTSTRLRAFAPAHAGLLTTDERTSNEILLFQRRGNLPWPYHKHLISS